MSRALYWRKDESPDERGDLYMQRAYEERMSDLLGPRPTKCKCGRAFNTRQGFRIHVGRRHGRHRELGIIHELVGELDEWEA